MKSDSVTIVLIMYQSILFSSGIWCYELTNVALKKHAIQSSNEYSDEGGAELAVDGVTNQYWSGGSCSHTRKLSGSYWEVDLGDKYVVKSVKIYNRMDTCCSSTLTDVGVFGGFTRTTLNLIGYFAGTVNTTYTFQISTDVKARWIRVTRNPNIDKPLMLCEVEVMGYKPTFEIFQKVADASGSGATVGTVSAKTWEQCCFVCFKTAECAAVELKDSICTLLNSNIYENSTGENIYKLN